MEANLLRQEVSRDASTTLTVLTQTFDILGRVCMARNPDSGAKLIWRDVASATLRSWDQPNTTDERSQTFTYDVLRRPLTRSVTANGSTYVAEMTTYGESLVDAKARNARCQAYSHKDGAGIATDEQRDFHGKVTKSVRQLTSDAKTIPDWSKTVGVDETEDGDVDLFVCRDPDAEDCFADPDFDSVGPTSDEEVTTGFGARTWFVIVKANVGAVTYTVRCDEKEIF